MILESAARQEIERHSTAGGRVVRLAGLLRDRLRVDQSADLGDAIGDGLSPPIAVLPMTHGGLTALRFAVPDDQHVGDLLQLRIADLEVDLLAAVVPRDADPGRVQLVADRTG